MNSAWTFLTALGGFLARTVGPANAWTAAVLLGALLVDRALARRVRASVRMALYLPVALRLLLPMSWECPLGLLASAHGTAQAGAPVLQTAVAAPQIAIRLLVYGVGYLAITSALLAVWWRGHQQLRRQLTTVRVARGAVAELVPGYAVVEHEALGPMVAGSVRPYIVLPAPIVDALDDSKLRCVLAHEMAHIERGDHLIAPAMQLVAMIVWPIAPVWLAVRRVRQLMEEACDQSAVVAMESEAGAGVSGRRQYGETLLALSEWTPVGLPFASPSLQFGSQLATRVRALRKTRRWPLVAQGVAVLVAAGLSVVCAARKPAVVALTAASSDGPPATSTGNLDQEIIRRVIRRHMKEILACYQAGPALKSLRLYARFLIKPDGLVGSATCFPMLSRKTRRWVSACPKPFSPGNFRSPRVVARSRFRTRSCSSPNRLFALHRHPAQIFVDVVTSLIFAAARVGLPDGSRQNNAVIGVFGFD